MRRREHGAGSRPPSADAVVWHDVECGRYAADLPLWLELAAGVRGPVLDIGAGTGRVALVLARAGHAVYALERDAVLLDALRTRAAGLPVTCLRADACAFSLETRVGLCVVPMQTILLLADPAAFLRCAHAALRPDGLLAVALLGDGVEPFEVELEPDRTAHAGVLYESRPTALRLDAGTIILERRRERTDATGVHSERDVIRLVALSAIELTRAAAGAGFAAHSQLTVAPTEDRAGSVVVILRRRS
jgi:SAM-dependent methyltransferase